LIANGIANIGVLPTLSATQTAMRVQPTFPSGRTTILPVRGIMHRFAGKKLAMKLRNLTLINLPTYWLQKLLVSPGW
jgi:hypothetical protein